MLLIIHEFSFIDSTIFVYQGAFAVELVSLEVADIFPSVTPEILALTLEDIISPFTFVLRLVLPYINAVAMLRSIFEFTVIL